jgi:hypothetical protein
METWKQFGITSAATAASCALLLDTIGQREFTTTVAGPEGLLSWKPAATRPAVM